MSEDTIEDKETDRQVQMALDAFTIMQKYGVKPKVEREPPVNAEHGAGDGELRFRYHWMCHIPTKGLYYCQYRENPCWYYCEGCIWSEVLEE